jgi:hypothetical protein
MEEFLTAVILGIAEMLFEAFFELLVVVLADLSVRSARRLKGSVDVLSPILAAAAYSSFGVVAGVASVWLFPHRLFPVSRFHGISLLISPLVTGLAMSQIGVVLRRHGKQRVRLESFGYGFAFAFWMAIIRFFFVQ